MQCDGAFCTVGAARRTTKRTELDDRLVVATWMGGVQEGFGKRPVDPCPLGGVDGIRGAEEATEDTEDIAIHGRVGQVIGEGENSSTRVGTHARKATQSFGRARYFSPEVGDDNLGCTPEVAPARVVAQPLP